MLKNSKFENKETTRKANREQIFETNLERVLETGGNRDRVINGKRVVKGNTTFLSAKLQLSILENYRMYKKYDLI